MTSARVVLQPYDMLGIETAEDGIGDLPRYLC